MWGNLNTRANLIHCIQIYKSDTHFKSSNLTVTRLNKIYKVVYRIYNLLVMFVLYYCRYYLTSAFSVFLNENHFCIVVLIKNMCEINVFIFCLYFYLNQHNQAMRSGNAILC